jgi:hypothetical protein
MSLAAIIITSIVVASGIGGGIYFFKNSSKKPVKPNSKKAVSLKVNVGKITINK